MQCKLPLRLDIEKPFYFKYGSYFGGACEFLIIKNNDENCQVVAEGSNGYTLFVK